MSKPVKNLVIGQYKKRFAGLEGGLLVGVSKIPAGKANVLREKLRAKGVTIAVVKNTLAKQAFKGTSLDPLCELLTGPSAIAYSAEGVVTCARIMVDIVKDYPDLELRGAALDGTRFAAGEVKALSKYPTKIEAQGQAVGAVLAAGANLSAALLGPAKQIAGILAALETKLEKAEKEAPAAAPAEAAPAAT